MIESVRLLTQSLIAQAAKVEVKTPADLYDMAKATLMLQWIARGFKTQEDIEKEGGFTVWISKMVDTSFEKAMEKDLAKIKGLSR